MISVPPVWAAIKRGKILCSFRGMVSVCPGFATFSDRHGIWGSLTRNHRRGKGNERTQKTGLDADVGILYRNALEARRSKAGYDWI